jgi:hypothetical protein
MRAPRAELAFDAIVAQAFAPVRVWLTLAGFTAEDPLIELGGPAAGDGQ